MIYQGQKVESRSCLHDKTFELGVYINNLRKEEI